jgi:murein DD-endopeptidase MepM/ murein hydrolase activator NlpD
MAYSITPLAVSVDEGARTVTFTITRSPATSPETLYVSTIPDQGYPNSGDYSGLLNQAIGFAAGQTSRTVTLTIHDDNMDESNETFGIMLQRHATDPDDVFLARTNFTIVDNDPTPTTTYDITPGSVSSSEAAGSITFTVTRSSAALPETVYVSTIPDQGYRNDGDYSGLLNQAFYFAPGEISRTVTLALANDGRHEANETFGLLVQRYASDPDAVYLDKAFFTIVDDDPQPPVVALARYPATGVTGIGQGNRDNDDSHAPGTARQWSYDFLAANLTDVRAVAGGVVVDVRQDLTGAFRGYGNMVTILHDGGFYATYGHLTPFSATVAKDQRVDAGQIIARSGDSGTFDGGAAHAHLHVQLGSNVAWLETKFGDASTVARIADGSADSYAPAYFPRLVIRFDQRADPGLSTDTDYYGTMGVDDFTGNDFANSVYGWSGNDILRGRGGDDTLQGGHNADTLAGGTGRDFFYYRSIGECGDVILDFSAADDAFQFKGLYFAGLPVGTLAASRFRAQASNIAGDADDRFLFRAGDTTLWFDADGTGAVAPLLIADLQAGASVSHADILIV